MFKACVLADSISPADVRLLTFGIEYPREVLCEINTHCVISKNTSSSRAIPVKKMIENISADPYIPEFGRNQPGMQAGSLLESEDAKAVWQMAMTEALDRAEDMARIGAHKQVANRIVENYGWCRQILTATEWSNFFHQRTHSAAHPAMQKIARLMYAAMLRSTPVKQDYGQWHLPLITEADQNDPKLTDAISNGFVGDSTLYEKFSQIFGVGHARSLHLAARSAARCARVSYNRIDAGAGNSLEDDWGLFRKLVVRAAGDDSPVHASPVQHQATPCHPLVFEYRSNLRGWIQFRKLIPRENATTFDPSPDTVAAWGVDESGIVIDPTQF